MRFLRRCGYFLFAILFVPGLVESCGPFIYLAKFTTYHHAFPTEFTSGNLGVLRPEFDKADLLVAYRILSGVPLSAGESMERPPSAGTSEERVKPWIEARNKVQGLAPAGELNADKKVPGSDFEEFPNCLAPAFKTAADTLAKRIAAWGASSPKVAEWVKGQDTVFGNCSAGPYIPAPVSNADPLLAADRRYQIASAEFYAGQYDKAEADFDAIAKDAASPWHDTAAFVAARACIREGTMGKNDKKLGEAESRLKAIAASRSNSALKAPAEQMLGFVRARTEPEQRFAELGNEIVKPKLGARLGQAITDYTSIQEAMDHPATPGKAGVTDWIAAFQTGGDTLAKWRKKPTPSALLAALVWAEKEKTAGADLIELIAAAHALKPDSPATATATYYGILDQIRAGQTDASLQWLDEALARKPQVRVANMLRSERLKLARDWNDFLRYAPRTPVTSGLFEYSDDTPFDGVDAAARTMPAFDRDAMDSLNQATPLALWADAANNDLLPRNLQAAVAQAGWVRAVMLADQTSARAFAQRLILLTPELKASMQAYLAEQDPAAANFTAVLLMLRGPGFEPQVRDGWGRDSEVLKRDLLRDNWWSITEHPDNKPAADSQALVDLYPDGKFGPRVFLPQDQNKAAAGEWAKIVARGNAVNYLCSEAIAWAEAHPQDARVPESLALAVDATHYGPTDTESTKWSKRAFDLLHRKYPASDWAKRTKYWY